MSTTTPQPAPAKRRWDRPAVTRMPARDSRAGPNPINPEGVLANGS